MAPERNPEIQRLVNRMRSTNMVHILDAMDKLKKHGDEAIIPLLDVLTDENPYIRGYAFMTLNDMLDKENFTLLFPVVRESDSPKIRMGATWLLMQINDPQVDQLLWEKFEEKDWDVISQGSWYFISQGKEGTEEVLVKALQFAQGGERLAGDFLSSGNPTLRRAGDEWRRKNPDAEIQSQAGAPTWGHAPFAFPWYKREQSYKG